ncbi:unnamed protein product [Prorocentrum cordatum]|uniref:Uncharacterized protein n=1 Tax=Prorocentrum cordatum TaxID=2364126 RepID=A0ABN9XWC4_9DINO|nr:unnamed protein product [Polarella glacialis]
MAAPSDSDDAPLLPGRPPKRHCPEAEARPEPAPEGSVDLDAVAASYQQETGASGIEAAGVAADALNAALRASLSGVGGSACEAAEAAAKSAARQRARRARLQERAIAAEMEEFDREQARSELEARATRAVASKADRMADDAAHRRAQREERALLASMQRDLTEARSRFGGGAAARRRGAVPRACGADGGTQAASTMPAMSSDPTLRRARALCSGAALVIAQLEEHPMLRSASTPALPRLRAGAGAGAGAACAARLSPPPPPGEAELVARAKALLEDYNPPAARSRGPPAALAAEASAAASAPGSPAVAAAAAAPAATSPSAKALHGRACLEVSPGRGRGR